MERQSTNSITHLVKIVAREVFKEEFAGRLDNKLRAYIDRELARQLQNFRVSPAEKGHRSWRYWKEEEDTHLRISFDEFIADVGLRMGRTSSSVRCRIAKKILGQV